VSRDMGFGVWLRRSRGGGLEERYRLRVFGHGKRGQQGEERGWGDCGRAMLIWAW